MRNNFPNAVYHLSDLTPEQFLERGFPNKVVKDTFAAINALVDHRIDPDKRLKSFQTLDKTLSGKNGIYRMPIVYTIACSADMRKQEVNGCGPSWLPPLPSGPWDECCFAHDRCYNAGGGHLDRLKCDLELYICLKNAGLDIIAEVFGVLVVLFGWFTFDWGGDDDETGTTPTPEPPPCSGNCRGIEYRVTNLRNFQTVGRRPSQVLLNFVSNSGKADLEAEAERIGTIDYTERCSQGCRCRWTLAGPWDGKPTALMVPGNDPNRHVNFYCDATMWKRELSGECVR
ncbi:hypothetical protein WIW50_12325 [Flavobacteriaceae bacterium 3-367]|uniref:hypothetical protein n=1 Tax=Eudoraea algarum TaxID=3417568 RepID=UPI00327F1A09